MSFRALLLCCLVGVLAGVLLFVAAPGGPVRHGTLADDTPSAEGAAPASYHRAVMRAAPSVVSVYASYSRSRRGSSRRLDTAQGSGVIVSPDGLVVTNLHLIEEADVINVALPDGRLLVGERIGADQETDLAVLRVPASDLPALSLGAAVTPHVGDVVLAIGNPFDVGQTVTLGIVSATGRRVAGGSVWQDFIQIDAAINPGNSGGALINSIGELVGVNTAVFLSGAADERADRLRHTPAGGARGIGYAIPADVLADVVPALVARGRVERGWLGIGVEDASLASTARTPDGAGVLITDVKPGGPGARAGLRIGDVVLAVDGDGVVDARTLLLTVAALAPGEDVSLALRRDDTPLTIAARLGERPGRLGDGEATSRP